MAIPEPTRIVNAKLADCHGGVRAQHQGRADAAKRSDWSRAVELRDTVRAWMLAHCGEPDLADRNPLRDLIERRTGPGI